MMVTEVTDLKTRPKHYGSDENPFEPIKITDWYNLNFNTGNVIKYSLRAGKKDKESELDDMRKAAWYAMREVKRLENAIKTNTRDTPED